MTLEEQYILSIPGLTCFLSADHVNGLGVAQPSNGGLITEWKDISGNNRHATSVNSGIFIKDSSGVAQLQNNKSGIQCSNNLDTRETYKGSELTTPSFPITDFTCMVLGSVGFGKWDGIIYVVNRFSLGTTSISITLTKCLGMNDNPNPVVVANLHNLIFGPLYQKQFGTRPSQLKNLLNHSHTFHPIIWTYNSTTNKHRFYDQKEFFAEYTLAKPNTSDVTLTVFNNSLDPIVVSAPSALMRHGIGQEMGFWNRVLTDKEINQVQSYIKTKYNI